MEAIKQWAFSICAAMVTCGLSQTLLPKSSMEKIFRTTVSIFFLCCLLSPIVLQKPELRIELEEYAQSDIDARAARLQQVVQSQTAQASEGELKKIIGTKLSQMGINYHSITINMSINGQSENRIDSVEIELDRVHAKDHDSIRTELTETFGVPIRLGYVSIGKEG